MNPIENKKFEGAVPKGTLVLGKKTYYAMFKKDGYIKFGRATWFSKFLNELNNAKDHITGTYNVIVCDDSFKVNENTLKYDENKQAYSLL